MGDSSGKRLRNELVGQRIWHKIQRREGVIVGLGPITEMPYVLMDTDYWEEDLFFPVNNDEIELLGQKLSIEEMLTHHEERLRKHGVELTKEVDGSRQVCNR